MLISRNLKPLNELQLAALLAKELGCKTEVQAGYRLGRIDILSKDWLVEVKINNGATSEKAALGQLLIYHYSLGKKYKGKIAIALIGKPPSPGIRKFCQDANICIFYHSRNINSKWSLL